MALRINGELVGDPKFHRTFLQVSGGVSPEDVLQNQPASFHAMQRMAEQRVLERTVMLQMARRAGLDVSDQEIEQERRKSWGTDAYLVCGAGVRADMRDSLLCRKLEVYLGRHVPRPGKAEVEAAYRERSSKYAQPERVHATQIFLPAETDAEREAAAAVLEPAVLELRRGKPVASVASRLCPGGALVDLGWINRGELVPELEAPLFTMQPGEVSPALQTVFGLHVLKVVARHGARTRPFAEVKDELARQILEERRSAVRRQQVWAAMQQASIESVQDEPVLKVAAEPAGVHP